MSPIGFVLILLGGLWLVLGHRRVRGRADVPIGFAFLGAAVAAWAASQVPGVQALLLAGYSIVAGTLTAVVAFTPSDADASSSSSS